MPLPTPNTDEPQDDFIARCMSSDAAVEDFPDQEQRAAVCHRQWDEAGKALSLEEQQSRIWDAWSKQFPAPVPEIAVETRTAYIAEMYDDHIIIEISGEHWSIPYTEDGDTVTFAPRDEWQKVKQEREWVPAKNNALKAIGRTDDTIIAANYIILFGGRDLEGVASSRVNPDGSKGEYFTANTDLSSFYTKAGVLYEDWEHAQGEAGDEILGFVDWKSARIDDKGVFARRVLNRRNRYVQYLDELGWFDDGTLGTSSEAIPDEVEKAADGKIVRWPLWRDTLTVTPMEPRMITENQLRAFKALGISVPEPNDTGATEHDTTDNAPEPEATPEPEHETAPEADASAVAVAKARARLQRIKLSLLEEQ